MCIKRRILTGRTRHRVHARWFWRKPFLVLQREWRLTGMETLSDGGMLYDTPYDYTLWRDAQVNDDVRRSE